MQKKINSTHKNLSEYCSTQAQAQAQLSLSSSSFAWRDRQP